MTKKKGIIAIIVVILIIISGAYYWYTRSNETKKDDYTLGTVARSNIGLSIDATGTIEPVNSVDLSATASGTLEKVYGNHRIKSTDLHNETGSEYIVE